MFPGLTFNIAASPAARTGPGASQSTPGASRRAASTGTLASQQKQQAVTPSSEEGLKQRGRPTEAPIPKAKKLMDEFKLAPPEHPKFFGAERATQAKAFTRLISVLSEEAQLTEDAEQDVELRRHKKCIEIMQSITKAYNVSKGPHVRERGQGGDVVRDHRASSGAGLVPRMDAEGALSHGDRHVQGGGVLDAAQEGDPAREWLH